MASDFDFSLLDSQVQKIIDPVIQRNKLCIQPNNIFNINTTGEGKKHEMELLTILHFRGKMTVFNAKKTRSKNNDMCLLFHRNH